MIYEYSIEIEADTLLLDDVIRYAATFNNINTLMSSNVKHDPMCKDQNKKYIVQLKISFGEYIIKYKDEDLNINFFRNEENPVGIAHAVRCHEKLIISSNKNLDHIKSFLKDANLHNQNKDNSYIEVHNFKNHWTKLNKLPIRNMDTIYLDSKIKDNIIEDVQNFLEEEDVYSLYGIPYKKTYLLEGVPGTGKTSLIFAIASMLKMNIAIINFGPDMDDAVFMKAISYMPSNSILLMEDVDSVFNERDTLVHSPITFSALLNTLDGVARRHKLITFITTNHIERLDEALLRPGRIDKIFNFSYASENQIKEMFLKFRPNDKDKFDLFYSKIKNNNYTTAVLQKFFFMNRKCDDIIEKIPELNSINTQHSKSELSTSMSMMYS